MRVDLAGPTREQLHVLTAHWLHELAVEDALEPHQRPKLDRYAKHLLLSCYAVHVDADVVVDETEVHAFINERWLITVRDSDRFPIEPVIERLYPSPRLALGVSFLLYGLLDAIVKMMFRYGPGVRCLLRGGQRRDLCSPSSRSQHQPGSMPSDGSKTNLERRTT